MARVLDATRSLLATRTFDDLAIGEILQASGQSAGAFYARFSGKEALLEALCLEASTAEQRDAVHELQSWARLGSRERGQRFVHLVARLAVANRQLSRTLLLRVWRDPARHARLAEQVTDPEFEARVLRALTGPRRASRAATTDLRWAVEAVIDSCRHQFLFGRFAHARPDEPAPRAYLGSLGRVVARALRPVAT